MTPGEESIIELLFWASAYLDSQIKIALSELRRQLLKSWLFDATA